MEEKQAIRTGRHCVFAMHVHLIFVTKYRRNVFDGNAIERLGEHFRRVKNQLWSPSYFAASCGGAPLEIIQQYIEQQNRPL